MIKLNNRPKIKKLKIRVGRGIGPLKEIPPASQMVLI